jgi:hypothetical protein
LQSEEGKKQERVFHGWMWKENAARHRVYRPEGQIGVLC